jgi:replication factor C small subunit
LKKIGNSSIWVEKYRPQTIDDLIFPEKYKNKFKEYIKNGTLPNIGLFGTIPGSGKTSIATSIKNDLKTETLWLNGSKENNVDTFRFKVSNFASKISTQNNFRLIILDECDYLTTNAQALLRGDIEGFYSTARFIFTGNYPDRLIEPLLQRLEIYNLDNIYQDNKKELVKQILERLIFILENEQISYNKKDLLEIIKSFYPSLREMIIFIQQNVFENKLIINKNSLNSNNYFIEIFKEVKNKDFYKVKELVDGIIAPDIFYTFMWKNLENIIDSNDIAKTIILLADYYDQNSRAKNKHIPIMAFLTRLMNENIKMKEL